MHNWVQLPTNGRPGGGGERVGCGGLDVDGVQGKGLKVFDNRLQK